MGDKQEEFAERRNSLRIDLEAERIMLSWRDTQGQFNADEGVCIDLARHGALIEYKHPFALGTLLEVTFHPDTDKQNTIKGQVCRCSHCNEHSYHVAIQLISEYNILENQQ